MEIHISRKWLIVMAAIITVIGGLIFLLQPIQTTPPTPGAVTSSVRIATHSFSDITPTVTNDPARAAVDFAAAFYVVDNTDYEAWLNGLKTVSTDAGYAILTKSIVPVVWPEIQKAKTVTNIQDIQVADGGLALSGTSQIGGPWQIRSVQVHIDSAHLWPTMKSGDFTALVMVALQNGQWRFVAFITPEQIDQIKKGQEP
jgi:hypothetical protein